MEATPSEPTSDAQTQIEKPSGFQSIVDALDSMPTKQKPYAQYLKRKAKYYLIVGILFVLTLIGFIVWYFLLSGRI